MEDWIAELEGGRPDGAWDLLVTRYRRLIFAAIRHYARDYDDVMDVFARVCEALRAEDLRRLRAYASLTEHRARFSTWLVAVVHHLTIDWFRQRDGRRRLSSFADALPPLQRRLFELVFLEQRSHVEAYELIRTRDAPDLTFRRFQVELRDTYRAVTVGKRGVVLRDLGVTPAPEEQLAVMPAGDAGETREILTRAMGALSPEDRLAVQLFVLDELPAAEVARVVGLPNAKAVYNKVYRTLAVLRDRLGEAGLQKEDL